MELKIEESKLLIFFTYNVLTIIDILMILDHMKSWLFVQCAWHLGCDGQTNIVTSAFINFTSQFRQVMGNWLFKTSEIIGQLMICLKGSVNS